MVCSAFLIDAIFDSFFFIHNLAMESKTTIVFEPNGEAVAFSNNGNRYGVCRDNVLTVYDTRTGEQLVQFAAPADFILFGNRHCVKQNGIGWFIVDYIDRQATWKSLRDFCDVPGKIVQVNRDGKVYTMSKTNCSIVDVTDGRKFLATFASDHAGRSITQAGISADNKVSVLVERTGYCLSQTIGKHDARMWPNTRRVTDISPSGTSFVVEELLDHLRGIEAMDMLGRRRQSRMTIVKRPSGPPIHFDGSVMTLKLRYLSDDHIITGTRNGDRDMLGLVDVTDGEVLWSVELPGFCRQILPLSDSTFLICADVRTQLRVEIRSVCDGGLLTFSAPSNVIQSNRYIRASEDRFVVGVRGGFSVYNTTFRFSPWMFDNYGPSIRAVIRSFYASSWRWLPNDLIGVVMEYWSWHARQN
jgi:hypothetical protein